MLQNYILRNDVCLKSLCYYIFECLDCLANSMFAFVANDYNSIWRDKIAVLWNFYAKTNKQNPNIEKVPKCPRLEYSTQMATIHQETGDMLCYFNSQSQQPPCSLNGNVSVSVNEPDTARFLEIKASLEKVDNLGVLNSIWSFTSRKYPTTAFSFKIIPQRKRHYQTNCP